MLLVLLYLNKKYVNVDEFSKNFVSYLKNVLVYSEFCKMTFKNYDNVSTNLKNEPVVDTLLTCIEKLKQIIMSKDKATELSINDNNNYELTKEELTIQNRLNLLHNRTNHRGISLLINDINKKKFADMVARSSHHMQKAADFSWKHLK
jgi:hypothetical protein